MLADQVDYVVGVDAHGDEHVLAVVTAAVGSGWSLTARLTAIRPSRGCDRPSPVRSTSRR